MPSSGDRIEFCPLVTRQHSLRTPILLLCRQPKMQILPVLERIHEILLNHTGGSAAWIKSAIDTGSRNEDDMLRLLGSVRMWGGAGSVANEALADNPGMNELLWQVETREFRHLMIDLGRELQRRGHVHPDMQSWLLAFSNWNQSGL